jgi:hypothetical protein
MPVLQVDSHDYGSRLLTDRKTTPTNRIKVAPIQEETPSDGGETFSRRNQ